MTLKRNSSARFVSEVNEATIEQDELTDRDMKLLQAIKYQNKLREFSKSIGDDEFDPEQAEQWELDTIGILVVRIQEILEEFDVEGVDDCQKCLSHLSALKNDLNGIKQNKPIEEIEGDYVSLTWGLTCMIQSVWLNEEPRRKL